MADGLSLMRIQNGRWRGCVCSLCNRTFYGTCLPLVTSPTCCAADYFRNGYETIAETAARQIVLEQALRLDGESSGAAVHFHTLCPQIRCHQPKTLATQSPRRIRRADFQCTNTGPRKNVWSKSIADQGSGCLSVYFFCLFYIL